jgi:hypothetical protein
MELELNDDLLEALGSMAAADVIHSNTHNHALVHNPFAWEEESEPAE